MLWSQRIHLCEAHSIKFLNLNNTKLSGADFARLAKFVIEGHKIFLNVYVVILTLSTFYDSKIYHLVFPVGSGADFTEVLAMIANTDIHR